MEAKERPVYKGYRIHAIAFLTGSWIVGTVKCGRLKTLKTAHALRDEMVLLPGEFATEEAAIGAARAYLDQQEAEQKRA